MFNFSFLRRGFRKSNRRETAARRLRMETLEDRNLMAGDVVIEWDNIMLQAVRTASTNPVVAARYMAIVSTSVYDAVNSITRTHQPYLVQLNAAVGTSIDAAAVSAAHRALSLVYPGQVATFDAAKDASLAEIPNGPSKTNGVTLGINVANQIFASRQGDGSGNVVPYTPGTDPGDWRPTPPAFAPPLLPGWGNVTPWAMTSGDQFLVNGIPELTSQEYADALNEVKLMGASVGSGRTEDQTQIGLFWNNGAGTATPPGELNKLATEVALVAGNTVEENARMFALLNIGMADAAISCWDTKFTHNFWRPVTAIREAETDGNDATTDDDTWSSLIPTPPFPTYSSGHSTFSGAAEKILQNFFGFDEVSYTLVSETPGVAHDRSFTSISQATQESADSRLYGGIHFRFDNENGLTAGRDLGNYIYDNFLQPSASLDGNTLIINGSSLKDNITVGLIGGELRATVAGKNFFFDPVEVTSIVVSAYGGNDNINIATNITLSTQLIGGTGNDYILGGSGNDTISGDEGKDTIYGRNGDDSLFGGDGNDSLYGMLGADLLFGEEGTDILNAGNNPGDEMTQ